MPSPDRLDYILRLERRIERLERKVFTMPTPQEILALVQKATQFVGKFTDIDPARWKGNDAPDTNHWDSIDEVTGGVEASDLKAWLQFKFTEAGQQHTVKAVFNVSQPGTPGGADVITVDGQDVEAGDFVVGFRTGIEGFHWYHRVLAIYKFTKDGVSHYYRFDGDT